MWPILRDKNHIGLCLALTLAVIASYGMQAFANTQGYVDRIVVRKAERKLYLIKGEDVIRAYDVALGQRPNGHKLFEGDYRTPEGQYVLAKRNQNSKYFLSIQISYPNDEDVERAKELGVAPGGMIMIHGQPNEPTHPRHFYEDADWTEGCIAVSNSAMLDIWFLTDEGTPIEIKP